MACNGPVLAIDTSAAHCAVALLLGDQIFVRSEAMAKGQAERLMPLVVDVLADRGLTARGLDRIGVGVGPGNFTGIRIAVSAARGMALGLGVPAIGISGLAALQYAQKRDCAAVPAPRDMAYFQFGGQDPTLIEAGMVQDGAAWPDTPESLVTAIAELAAQSDTNVPPPAPLYIRAADAAPPSDAPPVILTEDAGT